MARLPLTLGSLTLDTQGWYTPIAGKDASGNPQLVKVGSDGSMYVVTAGEPKPSTATYSPTLFTNIGANATLNVKASGGNVFSLYCHNANAAARYVQLHNTATVPTTTVTVPIYSFLVPPGGQTVIGTDFFTNEGVNFATGIAFAVSTTRDVYTAATAGEHSTAIHYA